MRRILGVFAVSTAIAVLGATTAAGSPRDGAGPDDIWHFVAHYGTDWYGCQDRGQSDVRKGWAGAYDCRTVSTFPARYDLWEA